MDIEYNEYQDTNPYTVEQPQGEKPAGFWIRLAASLLDGAILGIPITVVLFIMGVLFSASLTEINEEDLIAVLTVFFLTLMYVALFIVSLLYYMVLPMYWNGYTLGKKIVGIRIARMDGKKITFSTMLLRYVVGMLIVDQVALGGLVSAIMVGATEEKRSLHDLIAETKVVYDK